MKQVKIIEPGKVVVEEAPMPVLTEGNAILKILYAGICGSDAGTYNGTFFYAAYPRIPGHELSAVVVDVDENNEYGIKKGMVVTMNPYFNCGECYSCERGFVNCCEHNQTMGAQRDGGFCEYISMPLYKIYDGKGLSGQELATIEPFCIGYHGAKRGQIREGDKVLVIGAGTIGYLTAMSAKLLGGEVYVCDIAPEKLKGVEKIGIAGTILNTDPETFKQRVAEITGGKGFDVCLEAVGLPSTFQNAIDAAAVQGRVVIIGVGKKNLDFFYTVIQTKELNIMGSRNAMKEDFLELIDFVKEGKVDVTSVVSKVYPFEQSADAFEDFKQNSDKLLKVQICFSDEFDR